MEEQQQQRVPFLSSSSSFSKVTVLFPSECNISRLGAAGLCARELFLSWDERISARGADVLSFVPSLLWKELGGQLS